MLIRRCRAVAFAPDAMLLYIRYDGACCRFAACAFRCHAVFFFSLIRHADMRCHVSDADATCHYILILALLRHAARYMR